MINEDKSGIFRRIDWDEALSILASRLIDGLMDSPSKILFYDYAGNRGLITRHASRRLWNYLGAARIDYTICDAAGDKALRLMFGKSYGLFPRDLDKLKMVVLWGFNPYASSPHILNRLLTAKSRGGILVTIDVRFSETARLSDAALIVRPGSDGILALGIANYLISKGMYDKEFVQRYVYGFEDFAEYVSRFSLDFVEKVTGVDRSKIVWLAEELYSRSPDVGFLIGYGLQRRIGGGEIVRAIASIPVLLGIHRGFYYSNTDALPLNFAALEGWDLGKPSRIVSMERLGRMLAEGEFRFVYIHLSNPAATLPNQSKVVEGLRRRDVFVVVHETHWSDTARLANLVLPAPTYVEKYDVVYSYWHNCICLNEPVIEPLGESLGEYQLMCEIARKLRLPADLICKDVDDLLRLALGDELYDRLQSEKCIEIEPPAKDWYPTPSGKIELKLSVKIDGVPELPTPPISEEEEGTYVLITSAHRLYTHTQFEDVYGSIPSTIHISPSDAEMLGINEGGLVEIWNEFGKAVMCAHIDPGLPRGVIWAPRGSNTLDGRRINAVMTDDVESLAGGSALNSTKVRLRKVEERVLSRT